MGLRLSQQRIGPEEMPRVSVTDEEVQRWFAYRDNRNDTTHDYGEAFVQETLALMPGFIRDVHALEVRLSAGDREADGSA
jgi:hypothetical protein